MKNVLVSLLAVAGMAAVANAQDTRLAFEVWNGSAWTSSVNVQPGARVEYRVTVSYTGTATVYGLASGRYQPAFGGVDNEGPSQDTNAAFRNGGVSGNVVAGSMLSGADGASGSSLASYGRVGFGATAMNTSSLNVLTQFRHTGGASGAPAGSWIRLAGSSITTWPAATLPTGASATAAALNNISRGVAITQQGNFNAGTGAENTFYVTGTQNLVVFRGALLLSDSTDLRTITLTNTAGSLLRAGGVNSADDNRFFDWHTNQFGGSLRSAAAVAEGAINVVPTPASVALLGLGGLVAARRRRA
jgi:hypothetical protein